MQSLIHLPLEPYKERYTQFLHHWERETFKKTFDYTAVTPSDYGVPLSIQSGEVLDSLARPLQTFAQLSEVLRRAEPDLGKIYCSDFYTPGLDALAYSRKQYQAYAFLWAQTFDQHDFTQEHIHWMRPWELMAFNIYEKVFVASSLLWELIVTAFPEVKGKVEVVGLPFDSKAVSQEVEASLIGEEEFDVVYSSRWDTEKNPGFFCDLVEAFPRLRFVVCTGAEKLRGGDFSAIQRIQQLANKVGNVEIKVDLSKGEYYATLMNTKVQFNCASQDWVSYTLLEALTFNCLPLYPLSRSFPQALDYDLNCLYTPFDLRSVSEKLNWLLKYEGKKHPQKARLLEYHDSALERVAKVISHD